MRLLRPMCLLCLQDALYERLLAGALQAFYRSTMQGRNQQKLNEIRWGFGGRLVGERGSAGCALPAVPAAEEF